MTGDIVDYLVAPGSRAAGRSIRQLALPDGAVVAMVARGAEIIPPRGSTRLETGDHTFLVLRPDVRALVDRVFAPRGAEEDEPLPAVEFPLSPGTRIAVSTTGASPKWRLKRSAGRTIEWSDAGLTVQPLNDESIKDFDIALFSAGSGVSAERGVDRLHHRGEPVLPHVADQALEALLVRLDGGEPCAT